MVRILLILALVIGGGGLVSTLAGCAGGEQAQQPYRAARTNPNAISAPQIQEYLQVRVTASAHDIVRQLHPSWLQRRAHGGTVWAYEGGIRMGDADRYLRGVDLNDIERLEYLDSNAANLRYGRGHDEGVIEIIYRRG